MSLLDAPVKGQQIQPVPANIRTRNEALQIKAAPRRLTEQIIQQWERAFDMLWTEKDGITPAMRIAEIGTDAAELFAANAALVQFLATMLTGKDDALVAQVMTKVAIIPEFTVGEDGTVTLV